MICANCRRPLKHPAAEVGRMKFGMTCARNLGLIAQPTRRTIVLERLPPVRDPLTPDLFADQEDYRQ